MAEQQQPTPSIPSTPLATTETVNLDETTKPAAQPNMKRPSTAPSSLESIRQKSESLRKMSDAIAQNIQNIQTNHTGSLSPSLSPNNRTKPSLAAAPKEFPFPTLPPSKTQPILDELNTFLTHHLSFHRPIALVTSGGTITTLEQNTIRYLDNFSTGQRGAISVEEFCKRGYAVIHLWRKGSTAPYSRVLSKLLGCTQGNHALDTYAFGLLFEGQGGGEVGGIATGTGAGAGGNDGVENSQGKKDLRKNENNHDPWLTATKRSKSYSTTTSNSKSPSTHKHTNKYSPQSRMNLTTHILHNNLLQRKLRERSNVVSNNLLYTIPFTTIEEYLALLKLTTQAMNQCQSLGLIYLAAAVSDFYIPEEMKCVHKIQSRDYGLQHNQNDNQRDEQENAQNEDDNENENENAITMNQYNNTLTLTLQPVPKVIRQIRGEWSPHAYCISFKLETDESILKQKVSLAMKKYDVHMIIGNILETRHKKVSLFNKVIGGDYINNDDDDDNNDGIEVTDVTKSNGGIDDDDDDLEDNIISLVVEKHFEYIANHYLLNDDDDDDKNNFPNNNNYNSNGDEINNLNLRRTALMTGAEAAARHNAFMRKKKEAMKNEIKMKRLRDISLNVIGHALGCYLTYTLSSAIQKRL